MLPCRKAATSIHAARYLRLAESSARDINQGYGAKRRVFDGCIIEGKRAGNFLSATVIEPPGEILCLNGGVNPNMREPEDIKYLLEFISSAGDSTPYRPAPPLLPPPQQTLEGIAEPFRIKKTIYLGLRPVSLGEQYYPVTYQNPLPGPDVARALIPVGIHHGKYFIYRAIYATDRTDGRVFIRVLLKSRASSFVVIIGSDFVRQHAGGLGINSGDLFYWAKRISVIETGYGKLSAVFTAGQEISTWRDSSLRREKLVRLDIDMLLEENRRHQVELGQSYDINEDWIQPEVTAQAFPDALIPDNLKPGAVKVGAPEGGITTIPAITAMSIADLSLDNDGKLIAAIKYEVKQQSGDAPNLHYSTLFTGHPNKSHVMYGTGVAAFGLASWGDEDDFFNIHSREVYSPNRNYIDPSTPPDPLIIEHGADNAHVYHGERMIIHQGNVHRWVVKRERETVINSISTGSGRIGFNAPYAIELVNGQPLPEAGEFGDIVYTGSGLDYPYGAAITPSNNDFYISSDWAREALRNAKCRIGGSAIAMAAGGDIEFRSSNWIQSKGQGIGFMDGSRRRYEEINSEQASHDFRVVTVTCHQRETRDGEGNLVTPAVLIVGAMRNGKPSILIRKGPIWEEDMAHPYEFDKYWTVADAVNHSYNFYFYIGNILMDMFGAEREGQNG